MAGQLYILNSTDDKGDRRAVQAFYLYALYGVPVLAVLLLHLWRRRQREERSRRTWQQSIALGLVEPTTLHPVVNLDRCIGSGACVEACPERSLGIIDSKGFLINPSACIGHGACAASCPTEAIQLVFGTATRGVELPRVNPDFETNVPGLYIAGELGGMGLVRKAVEQGKQAAENIARADSNQRFDHDLVIVGAGPAGIAASLAAHKHGLRYITLEQEETLGGTTYHYPRGKIVMSAPIDLPIVGKIVMREIQKEALLQMWTRVLESVDLRIRFGETMNEVSREDEGFVVRTATGAFRTRRVLLAIGRRGTPRKLDIPGEELPKVVYSLVDPDQYLGQAVLVVGGGDSALEAALELGEQGAARVTLSYRGDAFGRVKARNRERLASAQSRGSLRVLLGSTVASIECDKVIVMQAGERIELANDAVIVCAGGELPTAMLKRLGVAIELHQGA